MVVKKGSNKKPTTSNVTPNESEGKIAECISGTGKFFYPLGATYEGDWIITADAAAYAGREEGDPAAAPLPPPNSMAPPPPPPPASSSSSLSSLPPHHEQPSSRPNRLRHGRGVYTDGGYEYTGEWKHDKMHGQVSIGVRACDEVALGCFKYESGAFYDGQWNNNIYTGLGTYMWPNGAKYVGGWLENKMHGDGTYVDKDGNSWVGQFFNGTGPGLVMEIQ